MLVGLRLIDWSDLSFLSDNSWLASIEFPCDFIQSSNDSVIPIRFPTIVQQTPVPRQVRGSTRVPAYSWRCCPGRGAEVGEKKFVPNFILRNHENGDLLRVILLWVTFQSAIYRPTAKNSLEERISRSQIHIEFYSPSHCQRTPFHLNEIYCIWEDTVFNFM